MGYFYLQINPKLRATNLKFPNYLVEFFFTVNSKYMKQKVYTLHICISFLNFLFLFLGKKYQIPKLLGPRNEKQ